MMGLVTQGLSSGSQQGLLTEGLTGFVVAPVVFCLPRLAIAVLREPRLTLAAIAGPELTAVALGYPWLALAVLSEPELGAIALAAPFWNWGQCDE